MVKRGGRVRELLRSNDAVLLSWLRAALAGEGIDSVVLDLHTSIVTFGVIQRRLMVADEDLVRAERVVEDARQAFGGF